MDRHLAGTIPPVAAAARVPRAGNSAEASAHHPERLPQQDQEAGAIEDRKDLGEQGVHGEGPLES